VSAVFRSTVFFSAICLGTLQGCSGSEPDSNADTDNSGGTTGNTGGVSSSGGTSGVGGENSSGGAPTGGSSSGGDGSGGDSSGGDGAGGSSGAEFAFLSPAWETNNNDDCSAESREPCPLYPQDNTNFGANVSPEMTFENPPGDTQSFAIVLYDMVNGFTHWVIWDIPASSTTLPASLPGGSPLTNPPGAQQAGFGAPPAYFGSGACGNVYEHRLYALSVATLPDNLSTADDVRAELEGSADVLGEVFVRMQSRDYCTQ